MNLQNIVVFASVCLNWVPSKEKALDSHQLPVNGMGSVLFFMRSQNGKYGISYQRSKINTDEKKKKQKIIKCIHVFLFSFFIPFVAHFRRFFFFFSSLCYLFVLLSVWNPRNSHFLLQCFFFCFVLLFFIYPLQKLIWNGKRSQR